MKVHQSAEDYLECILMLSEKQGDVHSIDVARSLEVSKPSVSIAMKKLREQKLITVDGDGVIKFTKAGKKIAENTYDKHKLLRSILIDIGVEANTAEEEACMIEHVISDDTYNKILTAFNKKSKD
jgi:Mn-dependent DtxR family transcriptional regulator